MPLFSNRFTRLADRVDALLDRLDNPPDQPVDPDQPADRSTIDNLQRANADLQGALKKSREQCHEFNVANNTLQVQNSRLEAEITKLRGDVDLISRRNIDNSVTIESFQAKIAELSRLNMNLTGQKQQAEGERDKLKREAQNHIADELQLRNERDAAERKVAELEAQAQRMGHASTQWFNKYGDAERRIYSLKQQLKKAKAAADKKPTALVVPPKPAKKKQPAKPAGKKAPLPSPGVSRTKGQKGTKKAPVRRQG